MNVKSFPKTAYRGYAGGCAVPRENAEAEKRLLSPEYIDGQSVNIYIRNIKINRLIPLKKGRATPCPFGLRPH